MGLMEFVVLVETSHGPRPDGATTKLFVDVPLCFPMFNIIA